MRLGYILNNWRRHGEDRWSIGATDPFSSGDAFDGWRDHQPRATDPPVARARFWLTTTGWRRYGLIGTREQPGGQTQTQTQT